MVETSHTSGFWPNLGAPLRTMGQKIADFVAPASEASHGEDAYRISIELPGVEEKDIDLTVADGVVHLKGEKRSERQETGESWFFSERAYGSFSRSFRLPPDADEGKVTARLRDGVLTVMIPKRSAAEAETRKKVRIEAG